MADKTYKELSKRLNSKKKGGSNFRSYSESGSSEGSEKIGTPERPQAKPQPEKTKGPKKKTVSPATFVFSNKKAVIILSVVAVLVLCTYALFRKDATEITINGEIVGQLKTTKTTKEELLATINAKLKQEEATDVQIEDEIVLTAVNGKRKLLMEYSDLINKITKEVSYKVKAAEITVNGTPIGIVKNQAEAQSVFDEVMAKYKPEGENVTAKFVEDVAAVDKFVRKDYINPNDQIKQELEKNQVEQNVYTVKDGDSLSKIAAANGMSRADIAEYNPDMDTSGQIHPGDEINVITTKPFVSVETVETKTETAPIKREVVEQADDSLAAGKQRIIQEGKDGKKEIITKIVMINGVVTSSGDVSEKIIEPAEVQIVAKGNG